MTDHSSSALSPGRIITLLCLAEVLSMTTFSTFPALVPVLLNEWRMSNSEAGLVSGMFFGGYMAAVPILASLTDRIDARRVYVIACLMAALGSLGFALIADGLLPAMVLQALTGAGLAGTYMPGLKLLSDHIEEHRRSRFVAFYTSTFGIGTSVSLLIVGLIEPALGWRAVFAVSTLGPLAASALVWATVPASKTVAHPEASKHLLDFRPVFRNRAATGYILGYAAHCYELFGMRSWVVAFLAFSVTFQSPDKAMPWNAAWIVAAISPLAIPASLIGNEIASRHRRRNVILTVMTMSALASCLVGFLAPLPWYYVVTALILYLVLIMADSSALTNGVISEASVHLRGATMAIYSFLGFGAGLVAPLVFGAVLDLAGGNTSVFAWGLAFASLGAGCAIGLIVLMVSTFTAKRKKTPELGTASPR